MSSDLLCMVERFVVSGARFCCRLLMMRSAGAAKPNAKTRCAGIGLKSRGLVTLGGCHDGRGGRGGLTWVEGFWGELDSWGL